ncbi:hypothetical protein DF185_15135 [Marinifilum breve]|uniref:Uncharacterized protein n=1 Tax=Marinifilum breve TaxID=2184082 RepID=A0A2V3ZZK8_9BACT|nr:hypothetical protein [Marinifilum breve]PXX99208.1 hypothetical protein DF185_15135 [Marinifilum breve]
MKEIVVLLMLLAFVFVSCDEDSNDDTNELLEIELISPVEIQGDMVNLPVNTPIRFQAKCNVADAGEIYWYTNDERDYHSMDQTISFDKNGLYRIYFDLRSSRYSAKETFIWINVIGKVVTEVEEDEVGCALVESGNSIYIATKKRKSFTNAGVFLYKYTDGELEKSDYLENVNQILEAKMMDNGNILFLTNVGFVLVNPSDNSTRVIEDMTYDKAHIVSFDNEELLIVGIKGHRAILERRKISGELIEKKTIYKDDDEYYIKDIGFLNENDFVILCEVIEYANMEYYEGKRYVVEKRFSLNSNTDNSEWDRDFAYFSNYHYDTSDLGINSTGSGVMVFGIFDDDFLLQWNYNNNYQINMKRGFEFDAVEVFSQDDYFCGPSDDVNNCHDRRIWGWQFKDYNITLFQNQRLVENGFGSLHKKTKIFEIDHSFKVDWVFESDDSYLLLINTQKYGNYEYDYKGNSKRYCSIFRMDKKGNFIDLY